VSLRYVHRNLAANFYSVRAMRIIKENSGHFRVSGASGQPDSHEDSVLGMNSHADISCAGKDAWVILWLEGRTCEVKGFHDSYDSFNNIV